VFTLERLAADAGAFAGGIKGNVRLVASVSAIAESLLEDVASFMRDSANRSIRVDIGERLSSDVVRLIPEGSASIGVCWDSIDFGGRSTCPTGPMSLRWRSRRPPARASPKTELRTDPEVRICRAATRDCSPYDVAPCGARAGRTMSYRVVVTSFDAALRVVAAGLGIGVIPRQVTRGFHEQQSIKVIALTDPWTQRRFAVCFRDRAALTPAALRMVEHLAAQSEMPSILGLSAPCLWERSASRIIFPRARRLRGRGSIAASLRGAGGGCWGQAGSGACRWRRFGRIFVTMKATIDFYFDFSSPYSYIANEWIDAMAARDGRTVARRAVLLGATFAAAGLKSPVAHPIKGDYSMRDFQRCARFERVPFQQPEPFPIPTQNAARVFWWLKDSEGEAPAADWARAAFRAFFTRGVRLDEPAALKALVAEAGLDAEAAEHAWQNPMWKERLRSVNEQAIAAGVFGAPFFVIDGEPFWGNDRKPQIEQWLAGGPF
jgi:2-hydroxychromene-2-carboxylate isomerase/DNA-binding transcriptional LysR family regulator